MEEKKAVETPVEPAAVTTEVEDETATRIAELEAEKAKLIEESANYKLGMLKAKGKLKEEAEENFDDDEDAKIERKVQEALANSKLAEIAREQDALIQKALKENKELKLARLNKNDPAAALGTHSEELSPVKDTKVTPAQLEAFKKRGWSDKDIERYKKNLERYGR